MEESETYQESQNLWADITVKFADGTTEEVGSQRANWKQLWGWECGFIMVKYLTFTVRMDFVMLVVKR